MCIKSRKGGRGGREDEKGGRGGEKSGNEGRGGEKSRKESGADVDGVDEIFNAALPNVITVAVVGNSLQDGESVAHAKRFCVATCVG